MSRRKQFFMTRSEYMKLWRQSNPEKCLAYHQTRYGRPGRPPGHNKKRGPVSSSVCLCGCGGVISVRYGYAKGHSPNDF